MRRLVIALWILDSVHLGFISHAVYEYTVTNYGNLVAALRPTWSVLAHIIVTGTTDGIVRGIFCHRIWKLSNGKVSVVAALAISSFLAFGCSIAFPIQGWAPEEDYYSLMATVIT
ncbi:hypothetical protein C8Q76DRAFT_240791 [Earliella scabrosa]|nr:hypothetical protein C8Q76DRAFT_240791 [Earliella scabrosa]